MVRYEKTISTSLVCNLPRCSICHFTPFKHQRREISSNHDQQGRFEVKWRQHQGKSHLFLTIDPSLFFKPRHEVKISMKRFFPRECNQKFRRSGPRRILNSSRRPAVQWRSRTAMKIILERSHVNKVSMKRKEERKYEKDGGKPSIYRKFAASLRASLSQ